MKTHLAPTKVLGFVIFGLLLLSQSGCGMRDPHFAIMATKQTYTSTGVINNKVDILWVIDNSSSMLSKQTQLASGIAQFMNKFAAKNLDYQIGIITTDTRPIDPTAANPAFPNDPNNWGQDSCLVHSGAHPKIVTPADIDPAASVAANEQLGNFGSTYAQGRDAIKNALSLPRLSGCNSGFLRSDAFLAIVSFTDSDDGVGGASIPVAYNPAGYPAYTHNVTASGGSITQPSDLLSFLDTIKTAIPISGGGVSRSYLMSSIVADDLASAACVTLQTNQPMYLLQPGTSWMNLSNTTYGTKASICDATLIANGLDTISEKILEATTAVQLSQVPDVSSITISLNGIPIGQDPNNGWTFEALTNRIIFHGSAIPSGAGVTISVNYKPNDVVR